MILGKTHFFSLFLAGVIGVAAWYSWPTRDRAIAAQPGSLPRPDVTSWPASFQQRILGCEERLKQNSSDISALAELAQLYVANGLSAAAEQILLALLRDQPNDARWPHYLANILAGSGRLDEAVRYWRETNALQPDYLPARLKRADALRKLNRREEAVIAYQEVLERAPGNGYALLGLALMDVDKENWGSAKERLEAAIAADNSFWGAFSLLASVADRMGDPVLANRAKKRADEIGRFKDAPDPWSEDLVGFCYDIYRLQVIGSTLATTGNPQSALLPLRRAVELDDQDARSHRHLGKVYLMTGDMVHAREHLERAIALDPTEPLSYLEMEKVYKANNDVNGAEALLAQGLKHCVDAPVLHHEYGLVLVAQGRVGEAVPHLERARELAPETIGTYEKLSMAFFRLGQVEKGIAVLQDGLKMDPNSGALTIMMARYAIHAGDAPAAENHLKHARELGVLDGDIAQVAQVFERRFGRRPN